ncbi:uncharacterized protein B0H64DRAFT_391715 [Chaetomium fimeti]|uniref:CFEM domain-containing protein n=1 Tax=Chaetomium fimeti TaxID=1854472 RepID=A0AAE0LU00_9PEZI|nr:hypothetical protein B0H64DRAFT_391715 [Chaetomium fimeti]
MQFSTLIIATLAAVVSASPAVRRQAECPQVADIPACGAPCILEAAVAVGCADTDYPCMCGKFDELQTSAASCVIDGCGIAGAPAVLTAAQAVCDACG